MGLRPLHFCDVGGRSHDEDAAETPEEQAVQAAGQPPALSAQYDSEVNLTCFAFIYMRYLSHFWYKKRK